jgi:hypothetical protein
MPLTLDNVKALVDWLGPEGAEAGIEYGEVTVAELRLLLEEQGAKVPLKSKRRDLITELLHGASKRLHKSLDEMLAMSTDELMQYFETVRPSRKEVMLVLAELDFHPGSEAQRSLYKYAARQIGETGMFQRVAKKIFEMMAV